MAAGKKTGGSKTGGKTRKAQEKSAAQQKLERQSSLLLPRSQRRGTRMSGLALRLPALASCPRISC